MTIAKKQVERICGAITDEEFEAAGIEATTKMERINSREGTRHGSEYLARLAAEIVLTSRLSVLSMNAAKAYAQCAH